MNFVSQLKKKKFHPRKGQNFLTNPFILAKIIELADIKKEDVILEIGAGPGNLTYLLAEKANKVFALEIDKTLVSLAKENLASFSNVCLINKDIRKINLSSLGLKDRNYKLVANLPYNITGYVLRRFLSQRPKPKILVLMVQSEVGKRIMAKPPKMSRLSLMVQFYGYVEASLSVKKGNFWPQPKVDSLLLKIKLKEKLPSSKIESCFFSLIQGGFLSPRKYLINNFIQANIGKKEEILPIFEKLKINPKIRPGQLSKEKWLYLAEQWTKKIKN